MCSSQIVALKLEPRFQIALACRIDSAVAANPSAEETPRAFSSVPAREKLLLSAFDVVMGRG